jgi:hypothetical protein
MKKAFFAFVLWGVALCLAQAAYSDTPYILLNIDAPGAVETVAHDINNYGKIVGYYEDSTGYIFGFLRDGVVVVPFAYPGAELTYATGINDIDWIVGWYHDFNSGYGNFLHNGIEFVTFDAPCGSRTSYVDDINNTYWMVGHCGGYGDYAFVMSGANPSLYALFQFPDVPQTYAFGMNDDNLIVGCDTYVSYFGTCTGGFIPFQVSGASQTCAYGINNFGQIAGGYKYGPWYGYVRETSGKVATIHMPNSYGTYVYGINELRQLVGIYTDSSDMAHAFVAIPVANPQPADLIVSEIIIDPPDPEPGEQIDVHVTVGNQGIFDAGGFFLDWYANESSAPAPPPFGNRREYVPYLAAGSTHTMNATWTYGATGTYQMYAYADGGYGVYESNENNNVLGPMAIVVGRCECDLNHDGMCDMLDWLLFGEDWGSTDCGTPPGSGNPPNDCECDLNADGKCDMLDWLLFGEDWGRTDCPIP